MLVKDIAKLCHEVNKAFCETQGDFSQTSWEDAPDWQKDSAINGVKFHIANPDASPSASHDSWLKEKIDTGWKYGIVKDVEKKEHPCCVPFEDLPMFQQVKDELFSSVVNCTKKLLYK